MVMGYADPFETLFAFQRALENRVPVIGSGPPLPAGEPIHP
jgi:hypothetical protein